MDRLHYLVVNFGGPRNLEEVADFLVALLTDQEVVRTPFPGFLHRLLFTRIAKKRAERVREDYALIGGGSPIYGDTEAIAQVLRDRLQQPVTTFHRYLRATHSDFVATCSSWQEVERIRVFPFFPQFSYATTGSIMEWFRKNLPKEIVNKMEWVRSYCADPAYVRVFQSCIREFLDQHQIPEEETILLFSAHGLPQQFIDTGDPYQKECEQSFDWIRKAFPRALCRLSYQSQFGKQPWILPYTSRVCQTIASWGAGYRHVVFVPLSFTSDHIETLFEVEQEYLPVCREQGFAAWRVPAFNRREDWIQVIVDLLQKNPAEGVENSDAHECASWHGDDPREEDLTDHSKVERAQSAGKPYS